MLWTKLPALVYGHLLLQPEDLQQLSSCTAGCSLASFSCTESESLQPDDPPRRVTFAQWFLNQIAADIHFASSMLFCDEATFSREGGTSRTAYRCPRTYSVPHVVFQQDGAPSHYARHVREHLDRTFPNRWIGRGGPVTWPPRSPDLSPLDLFLWGAMKGLVYDTPVVSEMNLVARISIAAARIREMPGVFEDVRQSMPRRCRACIHANGRNFEHFL
ncbi:transposable element Tcb1 transposase [Trichonephila clavipes]|nr:transposable element Tcb1 transposase [Trichonephila clavipes]